jgi:hypothetical protein
MDIDLSVQRPGKQVLLAFTHLTGLERFDDSVRNAEALVWQGAVKIDTDRSSESPASGAGAERIVK